jgi:hypothetical protein
MKTEAKKIKEAKEVLTVENAPKVSTISNIKNPEWGTKNFNYNDQPLPEGRYCSTWGRGCNSAIMRESEYKFWQIESYKN